MEELTPVISSFSSSSFASRWTYDVFLSFRGEDTRYGFTGNLYRALSDRGILTFIDNRLERGEEITRALFKTIEESRIAIIIFSANYASSTFCLEELVKILECVEHNHGLVWPIFYKVDPSDVRHLRGNYGEAIARHEAKFKNDSKLQRWKWALHKAANLSGWHFEEGYEYEFVKRIVEEASKRNNRTPLHVTKNPTGLEPRVEKVISLLDFGSNKEVVIVGIHGIGGIGKTTIACAVYNVFVDQFEGGCFLFDVREKSNQHGLEKLQETLLFKLTGEKEIKMGNFRERIPIIKSRLCQKKVLLILDDLNSLKQLEALAGRVDWFGFGSRIIITTRNKHLLNAHGVNRNYEVEELCFEEALKLLSWNAFKKNVVDSRYEDILSHVTNYCNGLPLALEIIGSNLFNKTLEEWKSALDTYEKIPNKDIQNVLKVSCDGLEESEKEIFLDIACFFNGYDLDVVRNILLNGHGYDPQYGIGVLETKSLVKIVQGKQVKIHDLMAQMGREIVQSQSRSNPGNWSRLWSYKDILCVLGEDKGTDKIEALVLKIPQHKEVQWDGKAFKKMTNLKILIIGGVHFSCGPEYLPSSLRVLEWENYPSSALPSHYDSRNFAILNLCKSSFRLVEPLKNFESLTELVLENCPFLKQVPDISGALSLRKIDVRNCQNLVQVHDSVGFHDKLALLNVGGCSNLRILPCSIKSASFQKLHISGCFRLQGVPKISGVIKNKLANPYLSVHAVLPDSGYLSLFKWDHGLSFGCGILMLPKLVNWMDEFQHFDKCRGDDQKKTSPALPVTIGIFACNDFKEKLRFFPTLTNRYFSAWRPYFSKLRALQLQSCNLTDEFLYQRLPWFPHLHHLDLSYNKFTILPECMNRYHHLYTLILIGWKDLQEIKGIPPNIEDLMVGDCISLTVQSSEKLLSRACHEGGARRVTVPGFRIPKWLDHHCMGSSISFWCRNKFPKLALCCVDFLSYIRVHIFINGIEVSEQFINRFCHFWWDSTTPCISFLDLHKRGEKSKIVLKEDEWNHVQCSLEGDGSQDIYSMGVHVYNKEIGMDNIRFIEPHPLKRTCAINHDLDPTTCLSLQTKFCPFLNMQVCESVISWKEARSLYHKFDNVESSTKFSKKMDATEKTIRIMQAPTKVKMLMWRILRDRRSLSTCCNLFGKKLVKSPMCPICETEFETAEHVFLECPWTRPLWFGRDFGWIMNDKWVSAEGMKSWLEQKFHDIEKVHPNAKSVTGLVGSICWVIWKARNEFILTDKPVDPLDALMTAKAMHVEYFSENK